MKMLKEGPGRYRIGDYTITHEAERMWRTTWDPILPVYRGRSGLIGEAFLTLRAARAHVEHEIEYERMIQAATP